MADDEVSALNIGNAIANDILCYLSTARNSLTKEVIVLNAAAFYRPEKILQAKEIIYNVFCEKIVVRKKSANQPYPTTIDLSDILSLMEKHDGSNCPRFLASNFDSLPPNGFEHMAAIISSLRDELYALRSEVCQLKENNDRDQRSMEDVYCIKQDIADIKVFINSMKVKNNISKQDTVESVQMPESNFRVVEECSRNHTMANRDADNDNVDAPTTTYSRVLRSSKNSLVSTVAQTSEREAICETTQEVRGQPNIFVPSAVNPTDDSEFQQVRRRRQHRQRNVGVIGAARNDSGGLVAAVQTQRDLDVFVGGCSLDSSLEDITVHCVSMNISVRKYARLKPGHCGIRPTNLPLQQQIGISCSFLRLGLTVFS